MLSLRQIYKTGPGPSSSHTIGPKRAALLFKASFPKVTQVRVTLFGSLSLTGKGHQTDQILVDTLAPLPTIIQFDRSFDPGHPNTLIIEGFDDTMNLLGKWTVHSIGGGDLKIPEVPDLIDGIEYYPQNTLEEIKTVITERQQTILDYIYAVEGPQIKEFLHSVLVTMFDSVERGLKKGSNLPGGLKLERMAKVIYDQSASFRDADSEKMVLTSYAYAVSEENASGGEVVTAPTCGAAGILPAVLYYFHHHLFIHDDKLIDALALASLFGNLVKTNASISGAQGGCQAEVGTACGMAAAAAAFLFDLPLEKIEYAAEVAIEHHLGLTCDPVLGLVQIPCIERNGAAALRAYDAALFAKFIGKHRKNRVSFDHVVRAMKETGDLLDFKLKETSLGGLARELSVGMHND